MPTAKLSRECQHTDDHGWIRTPRDSRHAFRDNQRLQVDKPNPDWLFAFGIFFVAVAVVAAWIWFRFR